MHGITSRSRFPNTGRTSLARLSAFPSSATSCFSSAIPKQTGLSRAVQQRLPSRLLWNGRGTSPNFSIPRSTERGFRFSYISRDRPEGPGGGRASCEYEGEKKEIFLTL